MIALARVPSPQYGGRREAGVEAGVPSCASAGVWPTRPYETPRHEANIKKLRDARMRAADDASTSAWHAAPNTSPPAGGRPSSPNLHDRYVSMLDAAPAERPPSPSLTSMFDGSGAVLTSAADPRPQGRRRFFVDADTGRRSPGFMRPTAASERRADEAPTPSAAPERALVRSSSHGSLASPRTTPAAAPAARAPLSPRRPSSSAQRATWASAEEQRAARLVQAAQRRFSVKAYEVPKQREARYRAEHPELAALADDFDAEEAARREARARAASPAPASPRAAGGRPNLHLVNLPKRSPPSGSSAGFDDEAVPAGGRANLRSRWQIGFGADAPEAAGEAPPRLRRAYSAPRLHPNISRRDYVVPGMRASYEAERAPPWLENQSSGEGQTARDYAQRDWLAASHNKTLPNAAKGGRRVLTPRSSYAMAAPFASDEPPPKGAAPLALFTDSGFASAEVAHKAKGEFRPPVRRGSVNPNEMAKHDSRVSWGAQGTGLALSSADASAAPSRKGRGECSPRPRRAAPFAWPLE